jgi:hypothetical protein
MQTQADKYRQPTSFAPGDQVLVETEALRANTAQSSRPNPFRLKYDGPFKVLKKVNENAYKIDFPESFNVHSTINVEKLKRFIPNTFIEREDKGPELISTDLGEERYVHEVLAKKNLVAGPKPAEYLVGNILFIGQEKDKTRRHGNLRRILLMKLMAQ